MSDQDVKKILDKAFEDLNKRFNALLIKKQKDAVREALKSAVDKKPAVRASGKVRASPKKARVRASPARSDSEDSEASDSE